jgi:formylglycine-generating enzyme required for sulfatase activity
MPELSTGHVFMSYSRRDDAVMRRIVTFLRQQGIKVWVDNEKLIPGTPIWEEEIEKAIKSAPAIVVVLSPDSKDSEWVRREISLADQYRKRVFPVLVRGDEESSISLRLIGRQYVDIRKYEEAGLNSMSVSLLRYLEELGAQEQKSKKEDQLVHEKVNIEQKSQEEAERLAAQKRERDNRSRKAKEKREAKNKAEREAVEKEAREKKQHEQMERDAAEKATFERAKRQAKQKAGQKKSTGSFLPIMTVGIFVVVTFLVIKWLSPPAAPALTEAPVATEPPVATKAQTLEIDSTMTGEKGETLVYIPAGEFTMGSKDFSDAPVHTVYLDAFWIDETEVTNEMYAKCVADNGTCAAPANTDHFNNSSYANHPVVYVNWAMAKTYCEWAGGDLPTEAQWEKAASWDATTQAKSVYPWGEIINCTYANYWGKDNGNNACVGDTTPVGSYESGKSPYGAYDMVGNVREWVNDWYGESYYKNSPSSNPLGPDTGQYRIHRSGSWLNSGFPDAPSAYRSLDSPGLTLYDIGFRCVRSLP